MPISQTNFNAGLVFVLARALQRRCPDHIALNQAAYWLRSHGYDRQAKELENKNSQSFPAQATVQSRLLS
jgi:hypothetical protein